MLNIEVIKNVLKEFHGVTGLNAILKDSDGNILTVLKRDEETCRFCEKFWKKDHEDPCALSDKIGYEKAVSSGKAYVYKCHAGLTDGVIPLFIRDQDVGAVVTGQFFVDGDPPVDFHSLAKRNNIPEKDLVNAFAKVKRVNADQLKFFMNTLFWVLNYVISIEIRYLETVDDKENFYMSYKIGLAQDIICTRFDSHLSMHEVAREVGISGSYFSSCFKLHTGITFKDFLNNVRIDKAKTLLLSTEKSITTIAYDVGYGDSNYFSTIFKKKTGNTPRQFRKQRPGK